MIRTIWMIRMIQNALIISIIEIISIHLNPHPKGLRYP
jgi:hypothetical protein